MRARIALHPLLIAIYHVIFLYLRNIEEIFFNEIIDTLIIISSAFVLLWLTAGRYLGRYRRLPIFLSIGIFAFFNFGNMCSVFDNKNVTLTGNQLFFVWAGITVAVMAAAACLKYKYVKPANNFLDKTGLILLVMVLFFLARYHSATIFKKAITSPSVNLETYDAGYKPDIYFIVMDAYGREDILKDIYGYSNKPFTDYLRKKGFYIADKSKANYIVTHPSVASTLNMEYIGSPAEKNFGKNKSMRYCRNLAKDSRVRKILKKQGYTYISSSFLDHFTSFEKGDIAIETGALQVKNFTRFMRETTILAFFENDSRYMEFLDSHRRIFANRIKHLGEIPEMKEPTMTYFHFLPPHPPFVFGPNGEKFDNLGIRRGNAGGPDYIRNDSELREKFKRAYASQLTHINKELMRAIDIILKKSEEPPIIILQGDHGPRAEMKSWKDPGPSSWNEMFSTLNAFYFPDQNYVNLYPDIALVNTFRVVLRKYFGANLDDLEYKAYYMSPHEYFKTMEDVTEKVEKLQTNA